VIAIDTSIEPFVGQERQAIKHWQNVFLADSQPELVAFFQQCVDENLIFNTLQHNEPAIIHCDYDLHHTMRYYSADTSKAEAFKQKLEDMSANFSLKKFWANNKFNLTVELSTVDYDTQSPQFDVVNTTLSTVWGINFPDRKIAQPFSSGLIEKLKAKK
jgi:hypothetical protein